MRRVTADPDAAIAFNAMLDGRANAELRGRVLRVMPEGQEACASQDALARLVRGLAR